MFAYCLNNPVNYADRDGANADTLQWWIGTMWWLCSADAFLIIGDIIYYGGIIVLGIGTVYIVGEYINSEVYFDEEEASDGRRSLPVEGEPNSDDELYDDEGDLKQRRHYGPDGKAEYDIDYKHAGDYTFPHRHIWDWEITPPRSGHLP